MTRSACPLAPLLSLALVSSLSAHLEYEETPLNDQSHEQHSPAVDYAWGHDQFLVVYVWNRTLAGLGNELWAQRVDAEGTASGDPFLIVDSVNALANPSVAFSVTNDVFLVVWADNRNEATDGNDIRGRLIAGGAGGGTGGGEFVGDEISIAVREDEQRLPSVAYDTEHHIFLVVWVDTRNSTPGVSRNDIYGQRVQASDGSLMLGNFQITGEIAPAEWAHGTWPDVAYSPAGDHFLVIWSNRNGVHRLTQGQRVRYDGLLQGDPIDIAHANGLLLWGRSTVSYAPGNSRFLVAHYARDTFGRARAWAQIVAGVLGGGDGGGELIGDEQDIGEATETSFFDAVFVGDVARWLVVWNEAVESGDLGRRGAWVDITGAPLISNFSIAEHTSHSGRSGICAARSVIGGDRARIFFVNVVPTAGAYGKLVTRAMPQWVEVEGASGRAVACDFFQVDVNLVGWNMIGVRPAAGVDVDVSVFDSTHFFWGDPLCESEYNGDGRAEVIAINGFTEGGAEVLMQLDFAQLGELDFDLEQTTNAAGLVEEGDVTRTLGADGHFVDVWNVQVTQGEHYVINVIPGTTDLDFNLAVFEPGLVAADQYLGLEDLRVEHPQWKQDAINPGHVETVYLIAPVDGWMGVAVWIAEGMGDYRLVVRDRNSPTTDEIVRHLLGLSGIPWHEPGPDGLQHTINGDDVWDAADVVTNIEAGR